MDKKESFSDRLKKDLAFFVLVLMLVGGPLAVYVSRSPYVGYAILGVIIVTFGPYLIEYVQLKLSKKNKLNLEEMDQCVENEQIIEINKKVLE